MDYVNYDDLARLEYGRLLWRNPEARERLIRHWTDARHPHRERFLRERSVIEQVLASGEDEGALDRRLRAQGKSLRAVVRDIPPVFGSFWQDSQARSSDTAPAGAAGTGDAAPAGNHALQRLRGAVVVVILAAGALAEFVVWRYLSAYPRGGPMAVLAFVMVSAAVLAWFLPRLVKRPRWAAAALVAVVLVVVAPLLSTLWPGGITHARFGRTTVGLCPLPAFDVTIRANGFVWFRDKSHRITLEEVRALAAGAPEVIVVGNGWHGVAQVDEEALRLPGVHVEVLVTPEAFQLYNKLRRSGKRVALLAHTTC